MRLQRWMVAALLLAPGCVSADSLYVMPEGVETSWASPKRPAVDAPLGDFFGLGLDRTGPDEAGAEQSPRACRRLFELRLLFP